MAMADTGTDKPQQQQDQQPSDAQPEQKATDMDAFLQRLPAILKEAHHDECWGVPLSDTQAPSTRMVVHKWLNSTSGDLEQACTNLTAALKWRKEFNPLQCMDLVHDNKFDGLGYITRNDIDNHSAVVTWNIYGAAKDHGKVFGDSLDTFLKWRVGLMERALQELNLTEAKDFEGYDDPYKTYQIHDYLNVSMFRMHPAAKEASKATIHIFSTYYCELLARKFFVNVPYVMSWIYSAVKVMLPVKTTSKFMMLSNGEHLAQELDSKDLPKAYGGSRDSDLSQGSIVLKSQS